VEQFIDTFFSWEDFKASISSVVRGFMTNLSLMIVAEVCVLVWGMVLALMRLSRSRVLAPLRWLTIGYIDLFRAIPGLLLIYMIGFGIPINMVMFVARQLIEKKKVERAWTGMPFQPLLIRERDQQNAVRRGDANGHYRSHQRGNVERRACHEQHGEDAAQGNRQRQDHHERISEVLVVHDHQQVDEHGSEQEPDAEIAEGAVHAQARHRGARLPRHRAQAQAFL